MTQRLRLEPITPKLAARADGGVQALADALDADVPTEWAQAGMRLMKPARHAPAPTRAIVVHRADERVIGDIRFEPTPLAPNTIEIGYGIVAAYRRKGYAAEASGAVLDWLFESAGVEDVIAGCDRRNTASVRTLRKLGFWLDGARGSAFWWVMTPELHSARRAQA